jgi:DNA-binding NarL/FixJ family response regulator
MSYPTGSNAPDQAQHGYTVSLDPNKRYMKKILLVDDHSIVRQGLRNLIELEADMEVTGEAGSGIEAIQLIRNNHYDVVVMDISMPDKNGVDTLHDLKHVAPELPVLILSGYAEEQYALNLMRNGCKGYLSKDAESEEIITAIRTISKGKRYISSELAELSSATRRRSNCTKPCPIVSFRSSSSSPAAVARRKSPTNCASASRPSALTGRVSWRR